MSEGSPKSDSRTARTFYLALGRVLSAILGVVSFGALSRLLDEAEYGTYRQALQVWSVAAPLLLWGLPETLYNVLPSAKAHRRGVVLNNLAVLLQSGAVFSAFLLMGGNAWLVSQFDKPGPGLAAALLWLAPLMLFSLPVETVSPALVVADRAPRLVMFQVVTRSLSLVATIAAVLFWQATGSAAMAGTALASAVAFVFAAGMLLAAFPDGGGFSVAGMLAQLRQAVPLGLSGTIAGWLFAADKAIVGLVSSPEEYAVYVNGAWEIPLVGILAGSATAVLWPEMSRLLQVQRRDEMLALWRRAAVKSACVTFPLFLFGLALADETIAVIYSAAYAPSAAVFRVYLLLVLVRIAAWTVVPLAANQSWQVLCVSLAGLAAMIGVGTWAVSRLGPIGAAWTLVAVTALLLVPGYGWLTSQVLQVSTIKLVPWRSLTRVMLLAALPGCVFLLKAMPFLPPLAIVSLAAVVYFPSCYGLLTRFGECPRLELVERWLQRGK